MLKSWPKKDINYLTKNADKDLLELAEHFKVEVAIVQAKLGELGLSEPRKEFTDPALADYAKGIEQLQNKKWKAAADTLGKVIGKTDSKSLRDRARLHLGICERHLREQVDTEDPYFESVVEKNRGNLEQALELCQKGGSADEERYVYLEASIQALIGDEEKALECLARAIELEPRNRIHAFHDPDLEAMRGDQDFQSLIARPGSAPKAQPVEPTESTEPVELTMAVEG